MAGFFLAVAGQDTIGRGDEVLHIDGGPIYTETDVNALIPEPFNLASAMVFMFIALYWYIKVSRQTTTSFRFMKLSSVILAIGGLGGSIYHGLRLWEWAMWMDWIPILVLCIAAAAYFIFRIYKTIFWALLALLTAIGLQFLNFYTIPDWLNTNTSYGILVLFVIVPLALTLIKTKFLYWQYPLIALVAFALALMFRLTDRLEWLAPIGTHFLWHLFGAVACHAMFRYMFLFKRALPRFELIVKFRIRKIRLGNVKKARELILKRKAHRNTGA
jgi:hemolysin III